ncbi:Gfo/Idh/MocA family protein [Novosphingobium sp.]|uniref:Gfo/Idh/MocA family protein n=1 Tax=Novosphingobium sp. TaxID=1874826 RepID=UPI002FDE0E9A
MADRPIRLGLVGAGKIVHDQHLAAIAGTPGLGLVAVADPHGGVDGVVRHDTLGAMLAAEKLDAVSICTPPVVRAALAREALAAGLAVMLEKPPALTPDEAAALAEQARAQGRTLFAAWHSRETGPVDRVEDLLKTRTVEAIDVTWHEDVRHWHPGQEWLMEATGFGVFDPAINAVSILTRILPGALAVEQASLGIPENRGAPIKAQVAMRLDGGAPVRLDLDFLYQGINRWDIVIATNKGTIAMGKGGHTLVVDGESVDVPSDGEYARLYQRFADLVRHGESDFDARPLELVHAALNRGTVIKEPAFEF